MAPDLDPSADDKLPQGSWSLGNGFVLLCAMVPWTIVASLYIHVKAAHFKCILKVLEVRFQTKKTGVLSLSDGQQFRLLWQSIFHLQVQEYHQLS